jgi:hypothetical protein
MSKQKIKIPENRVFLIKGGRNLTRWTPTSSDAFALYRRHQSNGNEFSGTLSNEWMF